VFFDQLKESWMASVLEEIGDLTKQLTECMNMLSATQNTMADNIALINQNSKANQDSLTDVVQMVGVLAESLNKLSSAVSSLNGRVLLLESKDSVDAGILN